MDEDSSDEYSLPADTLALLKEMSESGEIGGPGQGPEHGVRIGESGKSVTIDSFVSNFGLSQFWYADESAKVLAKEAIACAHSGVIGFLACPSIFIAAKRLLEESRDSEKKLLLFEYDQRFNVFDEFVQFDYKNPKEFSRAIGGGDVVKLSLQNACSVCVLDPPYLSEPCLRGFSEAVRFLGTSECRIIASTGLQLEKHLKSMLSLRRQTYVPVHKASSQLSNPFGVFVNYSTSGFGGDWNT